MVVQSRKPMHSAFSYGRVSTLQFPPRSVHAGDLLRGGRMLCQLTGLLTSGCQTASSLAFRMTRNLASHWWLSLTYCRCNADCFRKIGILPFLSRVFPSLFWKIQSFLRIEDYARTLQGLTVDIRLAICLHQCVLASLVSPAH